jgi:hypothetical protein
VGRITGAKDDYGVRREDFEGPVVGRIFRSAVAPTTTPWFWTIIKSSRTMMSYLLKPITDQLLRTFN